MKDQKQLSRPKICKFWANLPKIIRENPNLPKTFKDLGGKLFKDLGKILFLWGCDILVNLNLNF